MIKDERLAIRIHQLLHGYDEGHRLLAGSIKPDAQSAKSLVALSDLSGQGMAPGPSGYVTGYPLPQMNAYALARTWLAPEMPRPGCVWTHTLLIDFSDLVAIGGVGLLDLFVRPSGRDEIHSYDRVLVAEISDEHTVNRQLPLGTMFSLLEAVYEFPTHCIFVKIQDNTPADQFAIALWLQQWPRLQRNFRFCTWASSDRSRSREPFDLQFIPQKRAIRGKSRSGNEGYWVTVSDSMPGSPKGWAFAAVRDVISGDAESFLRKFLLRYGAETDAGRAAFKPLVQVWQALEDSPNIDLASAISAVRRIHPLIISLLTRIVREVVELINSPVVPPPLAIEFILQNLSSLGGGLYENDLVSIASTLLHYAPERIWPLFRSKSDIEHAVAAAAARLMKPEDALSGAAGNPDLFCAALEANPKLAASPLVWDAQAPIPRHAAYVLSGRGQPDIAALHGMFEAENPDVPQIGIETFGQTAVNAAVEYYDTLSTTARFRVKKWLVAAKESPEVLLAAVAQTKVRHFETLAFISSLVSYRLPSLSSEWDEWARALTHFQGDLGDRPFDFNAFILARALSGISPEPGILMRYSFDPVHDALMKSRHDWSGWAMLERELPEVSWWDSWDRANRVRLGVMKTFMDRRLPPHEFMEITKDEYTFRKLVDIATGYLEGCTYLETVSSWAKRSDDKISRRFGEIATGALRLSRWRFDT